MRIARRRHHSKPQVQIDTKLHRRNDAIRAPQLRLIDENGQNVGVVDTSQALQMARERGLDLIEVSPLANPPVAKILDFSKFKYEEEKERRKERAKQKKVEIKGIRLSLRIGDHDRSVRVAMAEKFLNEGDKVQILLQLRGRENQHAQLARELVTSFVEEIKAKTPIVVEQPLSYLAGKISTLITKQ